MIKAVLFDVDGVLLDSFEANFKFLKDLLEHFGYEFFTKDRYAKELFHLPLIDVLRVVTKSTDEDEITRIWNVGRGTEIPYDATLVTPVAGVTQIVQQLAKEYLLGVVTSRVRAGVYEFPELAAVKQYFRTTITYMDTENHKPHPEPLLLAAHNLGVAPEEAAYVGDAVTDMQAARSAGMKFIAYTNPTLEADAHVQSFGEIPAFVASLAS